MDQPGHFLYRCLKPRSGSKNPLPSHLPGICPLRETFRPDPRSVHYRHYGLQDNIFERTGKTRFPNAESIPTVSLKSDWFRALPVYGRAWFS